MLLERKWEAGRKCDAKNSLTTFLKLWFVKASARHWVCQTRLHLCRVGKGLPDRSARCWLRWWTPELERFFPQELFILVIIPLWWDYLVFMTCVNDVGGKALEKKMALFIANYSVRYQFGCCPWSFFAYLFKLDVVCLRQCIICNLDLTKKPFGEREEMQHSHSAALLRYPGQTSNLLKGRHSPLLTVPDIYLVIE